MQQARLLSSENRLVSPAQPIRNPGVMQRPGSRLRKTKLFFTLMFCFVLSLVVVGQYSSLVILNYRLSNARVELAEIEEASRILELEASQLSTIGRIERIAREELGMIEPETGQLRVLTARQGDGTQFGE